MNKQLIRNTLAASLVAVSMLGAGAAFASASMDNKNPPAESNQPASDTWITTKVKSDLLASENVPGSDIKVETKNGVVWLSGLVKTQAEHDKAVSVAKGIEGVKKVEAANLKVSAMADK
ncbi:MAG TPA: BON domain-containing protein [Stenotrophomonas sp.]|nr:BON domain-containing protein [Stenotrophomonas sp.]